MTQRLISSYLFLILLLPGCGNVDNGIPSPSLSPLSEIDGLSELQIERSGLYESPTWSPNGRSIAYSHTEFQLPSRNPLSAEIFIYDLEKVQSQQLTENSVTDIEPDWSPDGTRVVFERSITSQNGPFQLVILNIEDKREVVVFECPAECKWPAWSPDGELIAFVMNGLSLIKSDGSGYQQLESDKFFIINSPTWSPDGNTLGFVATTEPFVPGSTSAPETVLGIYTFRTGEEAILLISEISNPEWSPDGTKILFAEAVNIGNEQKKLTLATYDIYGEKTEPVISVDLDQDLFDASWSPDGTRIVFAYGSPMRFSSLYILDLTK